MSEVQQIPGRDLVAELPHLRRFAVSLVRDVADGDDLAQATLERALEKGKPADYDLRPWLFRICRNLWIDDMRRKQTRDKSAPALKVVASNAPSAETTANDRILLARTEQAIADLPDQYREVMSLVAVGGASYKEAAGALGTPVGTVMSRLARARSMIAEAVNYYD